MKIDKKPDENSKKKKLLNIIYNIHLSHTNVHDGSIFILHIITHMTITLCMVEYKIDLHAICRLASLLTMVPKEFDARH